MGLIAPDDGFVCLSIILSDCTDGHWRCGCWNDLNLDFTASITWKRDVMWNRYTPPVHQGIETGYRRVAMRQDRRVTLRECEPQGRFGEELREVVELWPGTGIGAELVGLESIKSQSLKIPVLRTKNNSIPGEMIGAEKMWVTVSHTKKTAFSWFIKSKFKNLNCWKQITQRVSRNNSKAKSHSW